MNAPLDMTRFIEARSDQLNADDLLSGPRTITITRVSANDGDQPVNVYFDGDNGKPFRPCKTIRRVMVAMWGADASQYVGRSMTIYRDPNVQFGGMQVGGIRVSHMSHIDGARDIVVMKSKGKKAPMKILPLAAQSRAPAAPAAPSSGETSTSTAPGAAVGGASEPLPPQVQAWVDGVIAEIAACQSIADLAELQAERKVETKLQRFPKERDDLLAMFNDRRAVIESDGGAF